MRIALDFGGPVLDPTCGSGTTAYVAEQWGRRWITIDTSRVPLALARQRLLTATLPYCQRKDGSRGPAGGLRLRPQAEPQGRRGRGHRPHITLKSIANDEPPDEEVLVDARAMAPDWVRSIRDQARWAGVPFFFKQWGGVHKAQAGRDHQRTWRGNRHSHPRSAARSPPVGFASGGLDVGGYSTRGARGWIAVGDLAISPLLALTDISPRWNSGALLTTLRASDGAVECRAPTRHESQGFPSPVLSRGGHRTVWVVHGNVHEA